MTTHHWLRRMKFVKLLGGLVLVLILFLVVRLVKVCYYSRALSADGGREVYKLEGEKENKTDKAISLAGQRDEKVMSHLWILLNDSLNRTCYLIH